MRRSFNPLWIVTLSALVPGCGLVLDLLNIDTPAGGGPVSTKLKAFTSESELESYFKSQIEARNSQFEGFNRGVLEVQAPSAPSAGADGDSSALADSPAPAPSDGFSGTTTQERGVDEADVVKTDGTNFYLIDNDYVNNGSVLRIVRASPADQMAVLSETSVDGWGRDLYLHGGKLVAITTGGGFFFYPLIDVLAAQDIGVVEEPTGVEISDSQPISILPPFGGDEYVYERPHTLVTVYDISNPAAPIMLSQTKFDGTQSATRMIDGVLHMVVANYQNYYFDVMPMLGRPELDLAPVSVETLLPTFERTSADGSTSTGPVVDYQNLYYPEASDGFGVVTLVSLDVDNDAQFTAVGVVAEPGLIYSSLDAMYLTNTQYDFLGNARTTTNIYKFAYENRGARPVATGAVEGRVLNQYSMSEYQGNLRVATTLDAQFVCGIFDCTQSQAASNGVYVLGQSADVLSVLGSVQNIAPRETIQAARFIGDKGYVVTFEQTDPLFTLDLADPANPRVVGQLEVPGFSTFLTPMDDTHLLAVGQYVPPPGSLGTWGVQLSVFDVSDFANPVRTSNVVIGDQSGAYSEATWDPKAFTYFAEQNLVALPISISPIYLYEGGGGVTVDGTVVDGAPPPSDVSITQIDDGFDGLFVYRATASEGLTEIGRLSTRFEETPYWGTSFTRGVFIGDKVYAVSNLGVREASAAAPSTSEHELFYGPIYEEPPILIDPMPVPSTDLPVFTDGSTGDGSSGSSDAVAGRPISD